jgi:PKD repeat protein
MNYNTASNDVTINVTSKLVFPTAAIGANTTGGTVPLTVQFTDLSLNETLGRTWEFGDGSLSTGIGNPIHTYVSSGTFTVNLTASNANGTNVTHRVITVTAPQPPALKINDFKADVTSGFNSLTVHFTSDVSGSPTTWTWKFEKSATQGFHVGTATHTYKDVGVFDVTLTVKDAAGHTDTLTKKAYITVLKLKQPKANFCCDHTSGKTPCTVHFTDKSTDNQNNCLWSFGDGQTSTQPNPIYKYDRPGKYTVNLVVKNSIGSDTKTVNNCITVTQR